MKYLSFTLFTLLLLLGHTQIAQAHFLASAGSIGAVLHIDPDDNPIVNQPATFYFDIKDKKNIFQPANCNCSGTIKENGQSISSQPLTTLSSTTASFVFSFPQKDVYQVILSGQPNTTSQFDPFTITWNVRVARLQSTSSTNSLSVFLSGHIFHFLLIFPATAYVLYIAMKDKRNQKHTPHN